ncbi:WPP domain-interacting protein 2-like [Rhododendron vialii]|uniref:WPP domain-interacting protein 2-like n=1 Tax=Rhododendron vialii TaxID=182163 RepID=UPI00265F495C|nr:WPP domain-interacting protein 2-like [Rhododendron vialii]XP_058219000.1 WPP domain-interacting protein 2-like [Rhododendron vialii]
MDLESECLGLESGEDNEVMITSERLLNFDGSKIASNGYCGSEHKYDRSSTTTKSEDIEVKPSEGSSPPAATKGYGLKKWRRIRREFSKDGSGNLDPSKILKRGLSASMANSVRPQELSIETRRKSDSSLSSAKAVVKILGVGSSLESKWPGGPNFAAWTDSENSEDRISKSSTAASVPKSRYEIPLLVGNVRNKNRMNGFSGKSAVDSVQSGEKGKNWTEASKKLRGERVKIEKENSHSSVEPDLRSSNFVFVQGTGSVTSNGRQSGMSTNSNGENSDEDRGGEQCYDAELQTGYNSKEIVGELEDLAQEDLVHGSWEVDGENIENFSSSKDIDPLVESIVTLQSAQEALEREVQKLRRIGEIAIFDSLNHGSNLPSEFASLDQKIYKTSSSDMLHPGEITQNSSHFLGKQVKSLKQNVGHLESKIEEANALLKVKDAKVIELECAVKSNESPKEEKRSTIESRKEYIEMEAELEDLFKQKIEAEVEYLAISRTIPKVRVAAADHIAMLPPQIFNELGDAESKSERLKREAETDQVLKLQKRVCKVTSFFFVQFMLLFIVFLLFLLQLSPHYVGVVPT